jgi:hypothetical protein
MEAVMSRVEAAIGDAIAAGEIDGGGMPSHIYIVGQTIAADGDRRCFTGSNCPLVESLGLLSIATTIQKRTAERWCFDDETEV